MNGVVDTGASYTVVPAYILDELGIEREETKVFSLAADAKYCRLIPAELTL